VKDSFVVNAADVCGLYDTIAEGEAERIFPEATWQENKI
jgi:hypothetical protein